LKRAAIDVKVNAAISEELFDCRPEAYPHLVPPPEAYRDLMFVSSGTAQDVIAEAHLDADSIFAGIERIAQGRPQRLERQRSNMAALA
jgi:hypothetical protein